MSASMPHLSEVYLGGRMTEARGFRRVHGDGLFPPAVVSDRDFAAIDAWLRTLSAPPGRRG